MKVICIDNGGAEDLLTNNKEYEVEEYISNVDKNRKFYWVWNLDIDISEYQDPVMLQDRFKRII